MPQNITTMNFMCIYKWILLLGLHSLSVSAFTLGGYQHMTEPARKKYAVGSTASIRTGNLIIGVQHHIVKIGFKIKHRISWKGRLSACLPISQIDSYIRDGFLGVKGHISSTGLSSAKCIMPALLKVLHYIHSVRLRMLVTVGFIASSWYNVRTAFGVVRTLLSHSDCSSSVMHTNWWRSSHKLSVTRSE